MSDQRRGGISWTDETWNPIRGCQRVNKVGVREAGRLLDGVLWDQYPKGFTR